MAALLNPNVLGGLHFLLTRAPEKLRSPAVNFLTNRLGAAATERVIKALKYLTIIAVIKKINDKLNDWAINHYTWKSQKENWTWSWEIAVITGGCSGIGKEIVKQLLEKDVRVAVLDIQPLPAEFERSELFSNLQ
jgi:all-trans-retinol dehydrogenase (NAD+)